MNERNMIDMNSSPQPNAMVRPPTRILYVEDHRDTGDILSKLLREAGHDVTLARTAQEARLHCSKRKFDVVLMDIGLPDGDGCELFKEITRDRPARGIALSGFGEEAIVQRAEAAGFDAHLLKPIAFDQLRDALQAISILPHERPTRLGQDGNPFSA